MYKNIFQVFTFYFYNVTPMEKHLWNWTQIIQNHFLCVCVCVNLITLKEEFYILVTSLTRFRRETKCICI